MAKPYDYDCKCGYNNEKGYKGRFSENLFNGEMHDVFEAVRHLIDYPVSATATPFSEHRGALWLDQRNKRLYYWVGMGYKHDKVRSGWLPVFADQFQIFDEIMNDMPSSSPVKGQLWLYNGVLMYYDGSAWQPVKTLEALDSQFNVSVYEDFRIYAPLNRIGSAVISDLELEIHLAIQKQYFRNNIDIQNNNHDALGDRWNWDDYNIGQYTGINFDLEDIYYQYLIPSIKLDRVFIDGKLDLNYIQQTNCNIQYKRSYLLDEDYNWDDNTPMIAHVKQPILVHTNPGKLTGMKKRVFKIDKMNPKILCSSTNTEYYGFRAGDIHGYLLTPCKSVDEELYEYQKLYNALSDEKKDAFNEQLKNLGYDITTLLEEQLRIQQGDYEVQDGGIYLSSKVARNFDYILTITYDFSWIQATGTLRQADNKDSSTSFYVPQKLGPMNIFVNGFDYEDSYWSWDHQNKILTIAEDVSDNDKYDVSVLGVFAHEYGYIRQTNIIDSEMIDDFAKDNGYVSATNTGLGNKKAYIASVHTFNKPLIFVNGIALTRNQWSYYDRVASFKETSRKTNAYILSGVHADMCWTIIEMQEYKNVYDEAGKLDVEKSTNIDICIEDNGYIDPSNYSIDNYGNVAIPVPTNVDITYETIEGITSYVLPHVILFVNGLMVKREDLRYDLVRNVITCEGLETGMSYILLNDSQNLLYTEDMEDGISAAYAIGKIDQTLVYHNGCLINESSSYLYGGDQDLAALTARHGEIRAFDGGTTWRVFNTETADEYKGIKGTWEVVDSDTAEAVRSFCTSYTNGGTAIILSDKVSNTPEDRMVIYGYNFSNYIQNPLRPITCWLHQNNHGTAFMKEAGYDESYIDLVRNKESDNVFVNILDPADPHSVKDQQRRLREYYTFVIARFHAWLNESLVKNITGLTVSQQVALYLADSKRENSIYSSLTGYYYDNVYFTTEQQQAEYEELLELAYGSVWTNKIFVGKNFDPVRDYVMVWLNGVRQYPDWNYTIQPVYVESVLKGYEIVLGRPQNSSILTTVDEEGYIKTPRGEGNSVPEEFDRELITGILTYIIQRAENGQSQACRYCILTEDDMIKGAQNVYTTKKLDEAHIDPITFERDTSDDFSLFPGKITVYADGLRLPQSAYTVLDNYTITINHDIPWIGGLRYPIESYLDVNDKIGTIRHLKPEELLIEIREDSQWFERTIEVNKESIGTINVYTEDKSVPVSILSTQDTILIFIDGLYHGLSLNDGYVMDTSMGTISIRDRTVLEAIQKDELETYLAKNPGKDESFTDELAAYRARRNKKKHQVTLEWR